MFLCFLKDKKRRRKRQLYYGSVPVYIHQQRINPILANICLHYVLDIWFEQEAKNKMAGRAFIIRYADDFVVGFRFHADAQRFFKQLPERMKKFGLTLAKEKTRKFMFNQFRKEESEVFDFLGFEYRWVVSRKRKDIIRLRTSQKRQRRIIQDLKVWFKKHQNKRLWWVLGMVKAKLRGLYNYFGVIGNSSKLNEMYILYKETCVPVTQSSVSAEKF